MNGLLNILKPPNATSFDIVSFVRRKLHIKKVGHSGTLDPMAVGVLPICIGKGTKLINYMQYDSKVYRCELTLGGNTDTQDVWGTILEEFDTSHVTEEMIRDTFKKFLGKQKQIPPMYSALKVKGRKLYELAREGIEIEREPRDIEVYRLDIISIIDNRILFDAEVSKGTYIRTLCFDIGKELDTGGYMSFLSRSRCGIFSLENTVTLEELMESSIEEIKEKYLIDVDYPLEGMKRVDLAPFTKRFLVNGVPVKEHAILDKPELSEGELVRVYLSDDFYAIGKYRKIDEVGEIKVVTLFNN